LIDDLLAFMLAGALHDNLEASPIAFILHERKQVVNQYLYLHFPAQSL